MAKVAINGGKVVIKGGKVGCSCCCPTTLPEFVYDSIERSFSKCGYPGLVAETPPRRFFKRRVYGHDYRTENFRQSSTNSGGETIVQDVVRDYVDDWEQVYTYAREDGARGCGPIRTLVNNRSYNWREDKTEVGDMGWSYSCFHQRVAGPLASSPEIQTGDFYCLAGFPGTFEDCPPIPQVTVPTPELVTITQQQECNKDGEGSWLLRNRTYDWLEGEERLDEYTDELLETEIDAALAAEGFDDDRNDAAGSRFVWSVDHLDLEKRISKAFLPLATVGSLVDGKTYNLVYIVRFTPEGGPAEDGDEVTLPFTFASGQTHVGPIDVPVQEGGDCTLHAIRWECPAA